MEILNCRSLHSKEQPSLNLRQNLIQYSLKIQNKRCLYSHSNASSEFNMGVQINFSCNEYNSSHLIFLHVLKTLHNLKSFD
jgi:hypothetical protein